MPSERERIQQGVAEDHRSPEHQLRLARESLRVKYRQQIASDEVAFVRRGTSTFAQRVLERRQRADTAGELDARAPQRRWNVRPRYLRHRKYEKPAEGDKRDERKMQEQHDVREQGWMQADLS